MKIKLAMLATLVVVFTSPLNGQSSTSITNTNDVQNSSNVSGGNATGGNATGGNATGGTANGGSASATVGTTTATGVSSESSSSGNHTDVGPITNTAQGGRGGSVGNTAISGGNSANTNSLTTGASSATTGEITNTNSTGASTASVGGLSTGASTSSSENTLDNSSVNLSSNQASGNSVSVEGDSYVHEARRIPVNTAYAAPLTSGIDTCLGSATGGVQTGVLGISLGSTKRDRNCERIKLSRELFAMGMREGAIQLLCQDGDVRRAMDAAGTPCAQIVFAARVQAPAAPAPEPIAPRVAPQMDEEDPQEPFGERGMNDTGETQVLAGLDAAPDQVTEQPLRE